MPPLEHLRPGDVVDGKYRITEVAGMGAMGVVYAAKHLRLGWRVALKVLRGSMRNKPEIVARFLQEPRTGVRLERSRHVPYFTDRGTVDGVPFFVMEHLEGRDLSALLRARGRLPLDESANMLLQVCTVINAAHALGIVHRDVEPRNVFVTLEDRHVPYVKVVDFGSSKSAELPDVPAAEGAMLGTMPYASPEQIRSPATVDARSDVWSLGVILYEMLTGTPPFTPKALAAIAGGTRAGEYTRPTELRPDIPLAVERLLAATLTTERAARLPSVEAFAARLAPFGTYVARAAYNCIRATASRMLAPAGRPEALTETELLESSVEAIDPTTCGWTITTAGSLAEA
jgi:serine/threonine-protein kinase